MKTRQMPVHFYIVFSIWFLILPVLMGCGNVEADAGQPLSDNSTMANTGTGEVDPGEADAIEAGVESNLKVLDEPGPVDVPSTEVTHEAAALTTGAGEHVRRTAEEAGEMISTYLLEQKPGLMKAPPLKFEEVPAKRVWEELQGQVFRVTEGIFKNEAFLLRHDSIIQLGEALGGQGLSSLIVTDLDQDGQSELLFSYSAGLGPGLGGGTQSRVGMYSPAYDEGQPIEADLAYLGTAALRFESPTEVSLTVVETNETTKELIYLDRLGLIVSDHSGPDTVLSLEVDPNLPQEIKQNILMRK